MPERTAIIIRFQVACCDVPIVIAASVIGGKPTASTHGLRRADLYPDERVVRHWPSPRGQAILTILRLLLAGYPQPLHRTVRWSVRLEDAYSVTVRKFAGDSDSHFLGFRSSLGGGGGIVVPPLPDDYGVLVNGVLVYLGFPKDCEKIQARIDLARTVRCQALGRPPPKAVSG